MRAGFGLLCLRTLIRVGPPRVESPTRSASPRPSRRQGNERGTPAGCRTRGWAGLAVTGQPGRRLCIRFPRTQTEGGSASGSVVAGGSGSGAGAEASRHTSPFQVPDFSTGSRDVHAHAHRGRGRPRALPAWRGRRPNADKRRGPFPSSDSTEN